MVRAVLFSDMNVVQMWRLTRTPSDRNVLHKLLCRTSINNLGVEETIARTKPKTELFKVRSIKLTNIWSLSFAYIGM